MTGNTPRHPMLSHSIIVLLSLQIEYLSKYKRYVKYPEKW